MYKVVYFGSSIYSIPTLHMLSEDEQFQIVGIVSQPDKPVGRRQTITPTLVSSWARDHEIPLLTPVSWKKERSYIDQLRSLNADVGVLAIYGKILPQEVIDIFPKGIVNIHPSILPHYRGPAPAVGVIRSGEKTSGVSIMLLAQEMDAGPVLSCVTFDLEGNEIPDMYYDRAFKLGTTELKRVLPLYMSGELKAQEQDDSQASYTHLLSRDDGKIDWNLSSEEIERMVRAFTPWPGTWTEVWIGPEGKVLLEKEMAERLNIPIFTGDWDGVTKKRMKVLTCLLSGTQLVLDQVQIEGETPRSFSGLT